ncbi:MAG TPA: hypothetical protein VJV79_25040 [Polyangiaceae bacterium]|nr:hypothetical protein [Polyangiaceae bacterium]
MNLWRSCFLGLAAAAFVIVGVGCHEPSRAQPNSAERTHSAAPEPSSAIATVPAPQPLPSATAPTPSAAVPDAGQPGPAAPSAALGPEATPPLLDEHGQPLPQTDQRPTLTSASFQKRIEAVAQAILSGDVEPALAAFFPLVAYQQVKDVAKPERDYKFRLLANFRRDLLEYHRALGAAASESKFDGITVSESGAKWMAPGSEGNKQGYFRVLRSRLRFTLPTGRSREFELTSLISWRGEWYVVHLHGFK